MASQTPAPAKLSAQDLLALSDVELAEYVEEHRNPDTGNVELDVSGFDELPEDVLNQLAERLMYAALC